jgi:hypothetical protein
MSRESIRLPCDVTLNTKWLNEDNFVPADKEIRVSLDLKDNGKFKKLVKIVVDIPELGVLFEVCPKERTGGAK